MGLKRLQVKGSEDYGHDEFEIEKLAHAIPFSFEVQLFAWAP